MRQIDRRQGFWLIALGLISSLVALFIDISVLFLNTWKMNFKDDYWVWLISSLLLVMGAVACIQYISPLAAGSGIP